MVEVSEERLEEALVRASRLRWYESSRWAMRSSFCLRRSSQVVVGRVGVVGLGADMGEGEARMLELELEGSAVDIMPVVVIVPPPSSMTMNLLPRGVLVWLLWASGEGEGESAARGGGAMAWAKPPGRGLRVAFLDGDVG